MRRPPIDTPEWSRDEADRCLQLADKMTDETSSASLLAYGNELLGEPERMEATLAAALAEKASEANPAESIE